ncbi:EutP/PduV family microcompartment system protein [Anaerotignum sp.]|nr:EutP/PduV family microcompartment system protein [Anaerotignum sp.]MBQ7758048.1 EutP/PduV family microcompartment system protein [Anaerotignum sp.]
MKKIMMIGKIGCGKTTLSQRLLGEDIRYQKTQAIQVMGTDIVDTPGEYLELKQYYNALTVTAVDADVILFLFSAIDEQNAFSPRMSSMFGGKPIIGVITKMDICESYELAKAGQEILKMAGAWEIVEVGFGDDTGIEKLLDRIEHIGEK